MPVYAYKGMNTTGKSVSGFVDADSARAARAKLRQDGVFPTWLGEGSDQPTSGQAAGFRLDLSFLRRISAMDLAIMTRQLATLIGAGVQLVEAIGALSRQVENPRLKSVLGEVRDRVNEGSSFADALQHEGIFSDLYIGLVRAGEAGGALEVVLERLAAYLESQVRLRNKVISILVYPLVMLVFALVVVAALVTVVLPQITELLVSLNQPLPIYTRAIIGLANFARDYWWATLLAAVLIGVALRAVIQTERGRLLSDRFLLWLPVVGKVVRQTSISRFTRTLSTLLAGGIPIVRALDISREVANNVVLGHAIDAARVSIQEGASVAKPLAQSGHFPPLVTHMIEVGERSGELESMLAKVAETYDEQVETTVTRLTSLLEPFLILLMVGIVLVIVSATLVPLLQITSSLQ